MKLDICALIIDCADAAPMMAFYQELLGGEVVDSTTLKVDGLLVIFRESVDYTAPTWPSAERPMQFHVDFFADDMDETERELQRLGATVPDFQPGREGGLVVLLDPAGHPFCIGTRI